MYCTHCGEKIEDQAVICVHCGVATANMRGLNIVKQTAEPPKTINVFGIVGFILSIVSLALGIFFCVMPLIGLIFSIVGMVKAKKCDALNGLAVAGLILSIVTLLFWAFYWIVLFGASMM